MTGIDWPRAGAIHADITAEDYHSGTITKQPALSASIAKILIARSPLHAWTAHPGLNPDRRPDDRDTFDLGSVAHVLFLEGERYADRVAVIDAADWRTNAAKEDRDAARRTGLIPILAKHWTRTAEMIDAIRAQLPELELAPPMFQGGTPERTLIWEESNGVTCKARLDYLHDDYRTADDFKSVTTDRGTAKADIWERRTFWATGCDVEAVFHARGVEAITGRWPEFRFLVGECSPPYGISVLTLHESVLELAKRKVDWTIQKWGACLASGSWPTYPRHPAVVEVDAWQEADLLRLTYAEEVA